MIVGSQTQTQTYQEQSQPPGILYPVLGESSSNEIEEDSIRCVRKGTRQQTILFLLQDRLIMKENSKNYCLNLDDECFFGWNLQQQTIWFQHIQTKDRVQFKVSENLSEFQSFIQCLKPKCPQRNFFGKYVLKQRKGKGKHGQVYLGERKADKGKFAIKIQQENSKWKDQMSILKKLHHPNLIYLREYFIQADHTAYVVMDYEDGGSLLHKIYPQNTLTYKDKLKVIIDMMNALEFLRIHGIAHRDIKPENILYSERDGNYKLADFGLAIRLGQKINKISGTPGYLAPQLLHGDIEDYQVDVKSDIYSMGLTFYEIFTSKQYYQGNTSQQILEKNAKAFSFKKKYYTSADHQSFQKQLLQKMIRTRPENRKNSYQIMSSSVFNKITRLYCEEEGEKKSRSSTSEQESIMSTVKKLLRIKTTT